MTLTLKDIEKIAERLRDRLSNYEEFKGLYVYGSRIYGNPQPDSDLDMLAIFKKDLSFEKRLEVTGEASEIELETDIFVSLFRMTEEELEMNPTFREELQKGLYYAATTR